MKILKGNYGECRFCDNMDENYGLPSLKEKSWDLCLTDPPYNIGFKGMGYTSKETLDRRTHYEDKNPEYSSFCEKVYRSFDSKAKMSVFTCGYTNIKMWYLIDDFDMVIWYSPLKQGENIPSKLAKWEPILCHNLGQGNKKFTLGLIRMNILYGEKVIHPCPKPIKLWNYIINDLKAESIIDPFLGSGTTAQCCEEMGIPWLGYEIMEEYAPDIEKRIQLGMKSHASYIKSKKTQTRLKI